MSQLGRDLLEGMRQAVAAQEILTKATAIFGSQEEALQWMKQPAIGLDQQRPLDLAATPEGVKLVEDHLERLMYGVYT